MTVGTKCILPKLDGLRNLLIKIFGERNEDIPFDFIKIQ